MSSNLIVMLAIGAMISCTFSLFMGDTSTGFLIRLVFTFAVQVVVWYVLGAR